MAEHMRAVGKPASPRGLATRLTMPSLDIKGGAGSASALFINDQTAKPTAKPGEALVKITAFGLNRMDLLQREGRYPLPPHVTKTLGVEFSGVVEAVGDG